MKYNKIFSILLIIVFATGSVYAKDTASLLGDIEHKSDLSQKTKLENSGASFIFTRDDINRMQAKYLKDLLKSVTPIGYSENRYAIVDSNGDLRQRTPFSSANIKVFIDNHEILAGVYDSGLALYGDIDLGFVDHVEIYTYSPLYEFTTESAFMIVRLYSKKAKKDMGTTFSFDANNYGAVKGNASYSRELDNGWSYFNYASLNNDKRKKYKSNSTNLSKDKKVLHVFSSFYNKNNRLFLDVTRQNRDTFSSASIDATPLKSNLENTNVNLGYDGDYNNLFYLFSYTYTDLKTFFNDDVHPISTPPFNGMFPVESWYTKDIGNIVTSKIQYKIKYKNNKVSLGIKYRFKHFAESRNDLNKIDIRPAHGVREQHVAGAFIEDCYMLSDNSVFTAGIQVSKVYNRYSKQDDILKAARIGYTYTNDKFIAKFIVSNIETSLDQYLINSIFISQNKHTPQSTIGFLSDVKFKNAKNTYELIFNAAKIKNYILQHEHNSLLYSYNENIPALAVTLRWTYEYNNYDKLFSSFTYRDAFNLPYSDISRMKTYFATIRNLNTYKKFDIFNELVYDRSTIDNKNYFDYSFGVIYHYNESFSFSAKGENVFDKAKKTTFLRTNPITFQAETPIDVSSIDQMFMIGMEYKF